MKMKSLVFICLSLLSLIGLAKVYKHMDSDNRVSYSDKPAQEAKEVVLPKIQTFAPPDTRSIDPYVSPKPERLIRYDILRIDSPANKTSFPPGTESIEVKVKIEPFLKAGDQLQIYLNREAHGEPSTHPVFTLPWLERGEYTLQVHVVDANGKLRTDAQSKEITFFQFRASVNFPTRSGN